MALYATDSDDVIFAADADPQARYWCLECFGPVKVRKGLQRFPHFYHVKRTPQCRLYSKSEDHMRVQAELQNLFPPHEIVLEKAFPSISRVADALWEKEKIAFEIQCSPIQAPEAEARIHDYRSAGYETIWLLDERLYNKRTLRPAEALLRSHSAYYLSIPRGRPFSAYDQFEIFASETRVKKGRPLPVDLRNARVLRSLPPAEKLPEQITRRALGSPRHFQNDRLARAVQSIRYPSLALSLQNWKALEEHLGKEAAPRPAWRDWLRRYLIEPYMDWLVKVHIWLND